MKQLFILTVALLSALSINAQDVSLAIFDNILTHAELNKINNNCHNCELKSISLRMPFYEVMHSHSAKTASFKPMLSPYGLKALKASTPIEYRETPDDPQFGNQWSLERINAPAVWNQTTGGKMASTGDEIVVAVVDRGYDFEHPDLFENVWTNNGEIPNNGIDDDDNGYVDDYYGLNVVSNDDNHIIAKHGTNVAGIIGAKGNNDLGVSGINWNIKLMLFSRVANSTNIIEAHEYIIEQKQRYIDSDGNQGANVVAINFSAGIPNKTEQQQPVLCEQYNTMGELGILTVGAATNRNDDMDVIPDLPAWCSSDYVMLVTNSTQNDIKYDGAGYGMEKVDIAAPGIGIPTTTQSNGYLDMDGCSASCPHVAGAIALLYSLDCDVLASYKENPAFVAKAVRDAIYNGVHKIPSMADQCTSGGILDINGALLELRDACLTNPPTNTDDLAFQQPIFITNGLSNIVFTSLLSGTTTLSLYNTQGKRINSVDVATDVLRENTVDGAQFGELAQGLYILTIANGDAYDSVKVLVY